MKNILILQIVLIVLLFSCSNSKDEPVVTAKPLIGKWKIIEAKISSGGSLPSTWTSITNGYELSFSDNGNYSTTKYSTCNSGTYTVTNQNINYFDTCGSSFPLEKSIIITNTDNELILRDLNSFEESQYKYKKISLTPN